MSFRETLKEKYENNLKTRYDDPAYEVVSVLFRVLTAKKVTTPGNFQSCVLRLGLALIMISLTSHCHWSTDTMVTRQSSAT